MRADAPEVGPQVRTLAAEDQGAVVDVLCEAFFDYPVMRFVLSRSDDYAVRLRMLIGFFVMARVLRAETLLGVGERGALRAAALVSRPSAGEAPPELGRLRDRVWAELGSDARGRYEELGVAWRRLAVDEPHLHLNMIGVRKGAQGEGLGRRLLEHVHGLSAADPNSSGISLTTEDEANVGLYRRFGYEVTGVETVAGELTTWSFFRRDEPAGGPR